MINNIIEREGPAFNDSVWIDFDGRSVQARIVGELGAANLVVGSDVIEVGQIKAVATLESGNPSRAMVFVGDNGRRVVIEQGTIG